MIRELLQSKFFRLLLGLALALMAFYLSRDLYQKYQIRKEIRKLEEEIATLENNNKDMLELLNYFKTVEYKERQARSLLNLQKPGEFAVALPKGESSTSSQDSAEARPERNYIQWWNYFFGAK